MPYAKDILEKMGELFESLEDGVVVSEGERVLYWNPASREFLGVSPDSSGERAFCDLLCGRLFVKKDFDCSKACPLRFSTEGPRSVTFSGCLRGRHLRVRCLKISLFPSPFAPSLSDLNLTLIEDVSARSGVQEDAGYPLREAPP